jgi:hypothetical protein
MDLINASLRSGEMGCVPQCRDARAYFSSFGWGLYRRCLGVSPTTLKSLHRLVFLQIEDLMKTEATKHLRVLPAA